jgi:probable phosphoglycerate mutase
MPHCDGDCGDLAPGNQNRAVKSALKLAYNAMMAEQIWLIRHGETLWSKSGQHTGRSDIPLTEKGEEEAQATAAKLAGQSFDMVLCSPLQRARRTCEIAGFLPQAILDPDCMEWDYGDLNGRTREDYRVDHPGWNIWDGPVPNGETVQQVADRAARVLVRVAAVQAHAAIFAHGHFLRILTPTYLQMEPTAAKHFALATARISVLGWDNSFPAMLRWNS